MINAHLTGAYISRLRRSKDWTQLQLAEQLHVTHQAVSRWEKGDSFPDVAVLPQLARLFDITVDDLLNGEPVQQGGRVTPGTLVEELARGNPDEVARLIGADPEGIDAMLEAAPLARPSQMDEVVSNLPGFAFRLDQVAELAPFVSQEVLQSILDSVSLEGIDGSILVELAPFVGKETLDRLALQAANGGLGFEELGELASFLSPSTLDQLIDRAEDPSMLVEYLEELAPFMSKAGLRGAISKMSGSLSAEQLLDIMPFLDQETLEELLRKGNQK